jgi:hypothetical protein
VHGALADVQIERFTQSDIKGADTPTYWGCERTFNANQEFLKGIDGFFGQPGTEFIKGLLSRVNFNPGNFPVSLVGFLNRSIKNPLGCSPNITTGTIAFNEWYDCIIRYLKFPVFDPDLFSPFGDFYRASHKNLTPYLFGLSSVDYSMVDKMDFVISDRVDSLFQLNVDKWLIDLEYIDQTWNAE